MLEQENSGKDLKKKYCPAGDPCGAFIPITSQYSIDSLRTSMTFNIEKDKNLTLNYTKDRIERYTTLELIEDLMVEIQKYSEELAILFPERVQKYTYSKLVLLWDYHSEYVRQHCYFYKKDSEHRIADKALLKLNRNLMKHYNEKALGCLKIIDDYKNSIIDLNDFFTLICNELGLISSEVVLTQKEASLIFSFDVESRLTDIRHRHNDYKFSLERLNIMLENIEFIFAEKGKKCYELIQKYKDLNKDLKEYTGQQHNVGKPHYFRKIFPGEFKKAYLLGFLGHDACLIKANTRISLTINPKDKIIINKLINAIELDMSKVKISPETRFLVYKGKTKIYHSIRLRYGCRPMYEDLKSLGFITIKGKLRKIPNQIIGLIKQAKFEDSELWYETSAGLTALAWLLGFYDADGSYSGFNYGVLYSYSKKYLNDIKRLFEIKADIDTLVEPGTVSEIFGRQYISKGMFGLRISSKDVFVKMMNSYEASLQRKRPPIY